MVTFGFAALIVVMTWFIWQAVWNWLVDWHRFPPDWARTLRRRYRGDNARE